MGRRQTFESGFYSNVGKLRLKFVSVNVDLLQIGTEYNVKEILSAERRLIMYHFEIVSRAGLSRLIHSIQSLFRGTVMQFSDRKAGSVP
jgi:hypothetical protein